MMAPMSTRVTRSFLNTAIYLVGVSAVCAFILASIMAVAGLPQSSNPVFIFLALMLGSAVGGSLWTQLLVRPLVPAHSWRVALVGGLTFGTLVFLTGYGLEGIEQSLFRRGLLNMPGIHLSFVLVFSAAIALVAGMTAAVVSLHVASLRQALRQGAGAALVGVLAFAAIDLIMYMLGWRVGHSDFPQRPTMMTVTALGLLAAALAGGTAVGVGVERMVRNRGAGPG